MNIQSNILYYLIFYILIPLWHKVKEHHAVFNVKILGVEYGFLTLKNMVQKKQIMD